MDNEIAVGELVTKSRVLEHGELIVSLSDVSVMFGTLQALDNISLGIRSGEVVGIVGDNGAGKSTLIKVMSGYCRPTYGEIEVFGTKRQLRSPADARALGISTVYQDLALIDGLSVWRNFFLGAEIRHRWGPISLLDVRRMRRIALQELREIGIQRVSSADADIVGLSGGERQSLAIIRAVFFGARLLILDEPTAALAAMETEKVFETIERMRGREHGIVYIDHNIGHVLRIADRVVVMSHGHIVREVHASDITVEEVIGLMSSVNPASRNRTVHSV